MGRRRGSLCIIMLIVAMICGLYLFWPFLAANLGLFPSLETEDPLVLSLIEGPPEGDIFKGVWYNHSMVLELYNDDTENNYRIRNYILLSHEYEALDKADISVAVSTFEEESDTWSDAKLVEFDEMEDIWGNPILIGQFEIEDDILPAKESVLDWRRQFRILFKISETAPSGLWVLTVRIMGNAAD